MHNTAPQWADDLILARGVLAGRRREGTRFVERMARVPALVRVQNERWGALLHDAELGRVAQTVLAALPRELNAYDGSMSLESWALLVCRRELWKAASGRIWDGSLWMSLDALQSTSAAVIRLRHFDRLSFAEIGARLSLAPPAVAAHYHSGLCRLQEALGLFQEEAA